jgi:hypothetical protein
MEAASAGHVDIVRLLVAHGADVNAVSGSGNTPLMYACVSALLDNGANVEDHNENGHTPLMEVTIPNTITLNCFHSGKPKFLNSLDNDKSVSDLCI